MYLDTLPNVRARAAAAAELQERQILGPLISIVTGIFDPNDPETSTRNTRTVTVTSTRPTLGLTTFNPFPTRTTSTTLRTTPLSTASQATRLPGTFFTTSTSTFSLPPTGTPDPSQNGQTTAKKGLPAAVIGIIVAAAVIFGLIFIAIIARKIFQRRRRNKRTTWGGSMISPYETPLVKEKTNPVAPTPFAYPSAPPVSTLASRNMNNNAPPSALRNNAFGGSPYPSFPPPVASFNSGGNPAGNNNLASYSPQTAGPATSTFGAPATSGFGAPAPYPFTGGAVAGPSNSGGNNNPKPPSSPNLQSQQLSVVKRTFVPSLPDELSIANGETVRVLSVYDDGWALCEKINSGDKGVVPQECLEVVAKSGAPGTPGGQFGAADSGLRRNSSLREQGNRY